MMQTYNAKGRISTSQAIGHASQLLISAYGTKFIFSTLPASGIRKIMEYLFGTNKRRI
jgi:hypothetical protein